MTNLSDGIFPQLGDFFFHFTEYTDIVLHGPEPISNFPLNLGT